MAIPSPELLTDLWRHDLALGKRFVVGADEAGRGAWAGPIVGAAVAIDLKKVDIEPLLRLNDSKKLTAKVRDELEAELYRQQALGGVRIRRRVVSPMVIDELGIQPANLEVLANPIRRATDGIDAQRYVALVDAFRVPGCRDIVKGDGTSAAIAAASIIAKQLRDRIMVASSLRWPDYGFDGHKGYGAKAHRAAIDAAGPAPFHRYSFRPLSEMDVRR